MDSDLPSCPTAKQRLLTHVRRSAWCRGCNRVLPNIKAGNCEHCHRYFDRGNRATFLRKPREDETPKPWEIAVPLLIAVVAYSSAWWLDGWVVQAIWMSEAEWPMATLLIVWARTCIVVAGLLYPLRLTRWDHFLAYWLVGGICGAVLALPFGLYAIMAGLIAGMGTAIWLRWFTISAFSSA